MALTQIKAAGLAADLIDETKLADDSIDSEHYNDGSIDHAHLANDCVDGDNISDDSIDSEHYVDGSIDHAHLSNDCIDGDNIQDDAVGAEHIEALDANLQLVDNAKIQIGTGNDLEIFHNGTNSIIHDTTSSNLNVKTSRLTVLNEADNEIMLKCQEDGAVEIYYDSAKKLETVTGGVTVTGTATADTLVGRHGNAPTNTQGSTYTLVAADAGKVVKAAGNVTLDQNIFADGDIVWIYNSSGGDITLIQGTSVTLRLAGDSSTGTRTIAQKGICTVLNVAANEAVAGGVGVS